MQTYSTVTLVNGNKILSFLIKYILSGYARINYIISLCVTVDCLSYKKLFSFLVKLFSLSFFYVEYNTRNRSLVLNVSIK